MNHAVVWTPSAEQDLADVWLQADDRGAVTVAVNHIDALLSRNPITRGEPFYDTVRTLVVGPLGVDFDVVEDERTVYVLTAWPESTGL